MPRAASCEARYTAARDIQLKTRITRRPTVSEAAVRRVRERGDDVVELGMVDARTCVRVCGYGRAGALARV